MPQKKAVPTPAFIDTVRAQGSVLTPTLRFALTFILAFGALFGGFEASRGSAFERFVVEDLILMPTTVLINVVTPDEHAEVTSGRVIASPGANLHVTRGCEGVEMFLMLVAGIIAFPASVRRRAQGLLFGCLLAYTLSVARLMALHYILRYSPDAWEGLHGLVLPLGPIILMALFFMDWSGRAARPDSAPGAHAV